MAQRYDGSRKSDAYAVREAVSALRDQADDLRLSILESLALIERSRELLEEPVFGLVGPTAPARRRAGTRFSSTRRPR